MKDLIIFADYGLDDAAATLSIFRHREMFGEISIVPIGGNVPTTRSFDNCITLLTTIGWQPKQVIDTRKLPQPQEYLKEIHGTDGMGDLFPTPLSPLSQTIHSFDHLLSQMTGEEIILSLGPTTLVKPLMERFPTCSLVLMGGVVDELPNFKGYEFNQALDPEAFAQSVKFPHVVITLDTGRGGGLDIRGDEIVGEGPYFEILRADQRLSIQRGEGGCFVWDDIAACYLIHPDRFSLETVTDPWGNRLTQARYRSSLPYYL